MTKISGFMLTAVLASAAYLLGLYYPIIGAPVFGMLFGMILNNMCLVSQSMRPGIAFSAKTLLQWSIILLGFGLSINQVWKTGWESLGVTFFTIISAFFTAYVIGKILGIQTRIVSLICVGTAICGGSAIAAVAPIIDAKDDEIAYSISTIFLFNILAVFIFPVLGHMLDMSSYAFGIFAGTAVNDASSVVAAGYQYSKEAGDFATIVKLTRTTMIVPIAFVFSLLAAHEKTELKAQETGFKVGKVFPWFIIGFIFTSTITTLGVVPENIIQVLVGIGRFSIVIALTAIGLSTDFKKIVKTGYKPLLLGLLVWLAVTVTSLIVQSFSGQL